MVVRAQRYEPDVDLSTLSEHPRNPRVGRDEAVAHSIDSTGWYGAVIAQESTRHVLAGHTRRRALLSSGTSSAPVIWLDVDDDTALRILLADNRFAELAEWDEDALADVLAELAELTSLDVVGFTEADLGMLLEQQHSAPPDSFPSYDDDLPVQHTCPQCGYSWSGGGRPIELDAAEA